MLVAEQQDKRIDDLVARVSADFARIDGQIAGLRQDINDTRTELRLEMQAELARIERQLAGLGG